MQRKRHSSLIVSLRHNIVLESDIEIAVAELAAMCGLDDPSSVELIHSRASLLKYLNEVEADAISIRLLTRHLRQSGAVALRIDETTRDQFELVLRESAFGQEVLFLSERASKVKNGMVRKLSRDFKLANSRHATRGVTLSSVLDYSTRMVSNRGKGLSVSVGLDALVDYVLDEIPPANRYVQEIKAALAAKKTTLYLTHELHLYKGKFFPRMVRALINRYVKKLDSLIVDPFVGSGTTLLEASVLSHRSIGIDVDPTSVLISNQKLAPINLDPVIMHQVCEAMHDAVNSGVERSLFASGRFSLNDWKKFKVTAPEPMRSRLIKRGLEEGYDLIGEIEGDSAKARCLISQLPTEIQPIMWVCLSHALTKKLRLRFVGIGNGRFTIDVARVGVLDLFLKKAFHLVAITEVFAWLKRNGEEFGAAEVIRGSAKNLVELLNGQKADLILTSPPYIPASSGREHYARARAIPLVFTGAATVEELDELDQSFIGEMSAQSDTLHLEEGMPPAIRRTLKFLRTDQQRLPKYLPTLNYYLDLEKVLRQTKGCLKKDGRAIFVVAKSHTFYIHKTKKILHSVDSALAVAELGQQAGLKVLETIHVPLSKSGGLNARPRSTDEYSESIIVFSK